VSPICTENGGLDPSEANSRLDAVVEVDHDRLRAAREGSPRATHSSPVSCPRDRRSHRRQQRSTQDNPQAGRRGDRWPGKARS
jgi:hypothetical protein